MLSPQDRKEQQQINKRLTTDIAWLNNTMTGLARQDLKLQQSIYNWFLVNILYTSILIGVVACLIYLKLR